ncbi:MAG: class I SAM-dependent methyltransferase [Verrucomicrobia bacterium]|nr:MAG: class I SAM-dependent methyltransferase [Verrucomicrobiota bacterium]
MLFAGSAFENVNGMSIDLRKWKEIPAEELDALERSLSRFYRQPPPSYYQIAEQSAHGYTPAERPFHCHLVSQIKPGMTVLEAGCGTAHLCPYIEARGGSYTGVDHSEALLAQNAKRFPGARFFPVGTKLNEQFNLVASLYTLEHIVHPPAYLENLWQACRPGGLIGIICPEFIESPAPAPSVFYGHTPRRLRRKFQRFQLGDALGHLLDVKLRAPRWQAAARAAAPGAFWINLRPRVLQGAEYEIDTDAVHMTRLKDLVWFLKEKGAEIVCTSADLPGVSAEILKYNCYVLARKPEAPAAK